MGVATRRISSAKEFNRVLNTPRPVFILFVSEHCPACAQAGSLFEQAAWKHPWLVSLVLDCAHTPRHPDVTGTPTLLIYQEGIVVEKLKGFGPLEEQEQCVTDIFNRYDLSKGASALASLDAPPLQLPSNANPHVPGYRPPPANGRAGSSPTPPGFDNPRSPQP
ncbi:hypothetical protein BFW89_14825 [Pseudomonas synxantha]|nr:hypothetical protein BFW89_14825 [Pseudomonas synxantha]